MADKQSYNFPESFSPAVSIFRKHNVSTFLVPNWKIQQLGSDTPIQDKFVKYRTKKTVCNRNGVVENGSCVCFTHNFINVKAFIDWSYLTALHIFPIVFNWLPILLGPLPTTPADKA